MKAIFGKKLTVGLILLAAIGTTTAVAALNNPTPLPQKTVTVHSETPKIADTATKNPVVAPATTTTPKAQVEVPPTEPTAAPTNPHTYGYDIWYAYNRRVEVGKTMPTYDVADQLYCITLLHDASQTTVNTPAQYAFGCSTTHMVFVEKVNDDGSIWVSEMNSYGQKSMTDTTPWGGWGRVDYKLFASEGYSKYRFVL